MTFFNLLDDSVVDYNEIIPKTINLTTAHIKASCDRNISDDARIKLEQIYFQELTSMIACTGNGIAQLRQSVNSIQLLAGNSVLSQINDYINLSNRVIEENNNLLKSLVSLIRANNTDKILEMQMKFTDSSIAVKQSLELLKKSMREDLEIE
ncbi:MAG: hypothetical protein SNG81_08360 [Rikenellaceae bacterium]